MKNIFAGKMLRFAWTEMKGSGTIIGYRSWILVFPLVVLVFMWITTRETPTVFRPPKLQVSETSSVLTPIVTVNVQRYTSTKPLVDIRQLPDVKRSRVYLKGGRNTFYLGEQIRVKIHLVDGFGKFIKESGDFLRIWMFEAEFGANATGYIVDNGDGTYDGVVKALWVGKPEIQVSIACTRFHIAIALNRIAKHGIFHYLSGGFRKTRTQDSEYTKCSVQPTIEGHIEVCNLTSYNHGLPWYCGKPLSKGLSCGDWKFHTKSSTGRYTPESRLEKQLMTYRYTELTDKISVTVQGNTKVVTSSSIPCNEYSKSISWNNISPRGYFYNNKWKTLYCRPSFNRTKENYTKCLAGRELFIFGDSTARQWFVHLNEYLDLKYFKGLEFNHGNMHHSSHAVNVPNNLSFRYAPHELPFYSGEKNIRSNYRPVSTYFKYIEETKNPIIVLHWYMHFTRILPDMYRQHVRYAKLAVQKLFEKTEADVYIKGAHAIMDQSNYEPMDFFCAVQSQILREEFSDIRDRVTFLDEWDITVASGNVKIHPPDVIIEEMVYNFMSHICFKTHSK